VETARTSTGPRPPAAGGELVLGRYRLVERLGSGGFGVVWAARDERLDRDVALKRIAVDDAAVAQRAAREAKAAARLSHPGIVALYEAGRDADAVYLISELVRGHTLARLLADGALSDRDVVAIGGVLCAALTHAHRRGVVHRDVKPQNVIVPEAPGDGHGAAKLTDFGIARLLGEDVLTRTGDIVGTLAYMAPEQAEGRAVTAQADLYALGLVLYEALSGVNPVRGRSPASTARRVGVRLPPLRRLRRDLPRELCDAIDAAVRPRPEERGRLADLRGALHAVRDEVGDEPGTVGAGPLESVTRVAGMAVRARGADPAAPGRWRAQPREDDDLEGGGAAGAAARGDRLPARAVAALGTGALVAAALAGLGPVPPVTPLGGAVLAAAAVAALPRAGSLAVTGALAAWLLTVTAHGNGAGLALLILAAALPALALTWRAAAGWRPAPALAPLLGLAALAGAWPAVAGQARHLRHRLALGALGAWWLLLAEVLTGRRLLLGPPPGAGPAQAWGDSSRAALSDALAPVLTSGALGVAVVWAAAAAVLPWIVRGRAAGADVVLATAWAAGLAAATQAVAGALPWDGGAPAPRGVVPGALAAGVFAVAARASRPRP
jgi:eukaryotic-like serine/threonine-protein kinase